MSFAFIAAEKAHFPVRALCRALDVTPSGYYAWCQRPLAARAVEDAQLRQRLRMVHAEHRGVYGRLRLQRALRADGIRLGDRRVRRLMREAGVHARGRRRYRATTDSAHRAPIVPNTLARDFATRPLNQAWAGDITALWTGEGWLYLAVLLDLGSRRVVGWAVQPTLHTSLVLHALEQALSRRRIAPGLLHHSDRGTQYASAAYQAMLRRHGLVASMSRKGDCWDNAVVESFFSSLKAELLPEHPWRTHDDAHTAVADYIERFYNPRRLHSTLDYQSPAQFEAGLRAAV